MIDAPPRGLVRSTTILVVRRGGKVVMAGDGQVSLGATVLKAHARKVRRIYHDRVLAGFAGSTADAFTLFEKFESRLEEFGGNLLRAAIELTKDWRTERVLRRLDAFLLVADAERLLLLSGKGDAIEPDDDALAIGSGGPFALAAARALLRTTDLPARRVAEEALRIAGEICVYTNGELVVEELG